MDQTEKAMKRILKRIECADDFEMAEIMRALISRQKMRYPEYEMVIASLPKYDKKKRFEQIDKLAESLKGYTDTKQ